VFLRTLAAVLAALALAPAADAFRGSFHGATFAAFTIAPGNMDCVQVHDDVLGWTGDCDPVNVVFPRATLGSVVARLHAAGWIDTTGSTQWLYFGDATLVPVAAQLALPDGPDPTMRYHVRLWQAAPHLVLGAVHHEHGTPHRIDMDWDAAEGVLARSLCSGACGRLAIPVQWTLQNGAADWRGWSNDAVATVIPPQASTPPATVPRSPAGRRAAAAPAARSGARARA
jgi:hypothetical protein